VYPIEIDYYLQTLGEHFNELSGETPLSIVRTESNDIKGILKGNLILNKYNRTIIVENIIPKKEIEAGKWISVTISGLRNPYSLKPVGNFDYKTMFRHSRPTS